MPDPVTPSTEGAIPAAPVAPETEPVQTPQDQSADPATDTPEAQPKQHWAKKRIDELTREKYDLKRERDHLLEVALRNQQPQPVQHAPATQEPPSLEQFNNDPGAYLRALAKHEAQQMVQAEREAAEKQTQQRTEYELAVAFARRVSDAAQKYPDFRQVVENPSLPVTPHMAETIKRLDNGPDVAYHLGRNPDEADRLARMDQYTAAAEIGRLSARLANPPVPVTKAPVPPPTLSGGSALSRSFDQMSMDEYVKARNAQLRPRK